MKKNDSKKGFQGLGKLSPCYLYISTSGSLLEDTIDNIKNFLKSKINFDTDFRTFDGMEEFNEEEFTGYVSTPSLFSPRKIVLIKYIEKVPAGLQKKVADLILKINDNRENVIFIITASKLKLNPGLLDAIRKTGKVVQLKLPLSGSLKKWLDERSASDGIKFTEKARAILIENVNMDLNLLKKEYEKLYDYISSETKKVIDENIVRSLVNRVYSLKIFDLVDYIGRRDKDNSLKALKAILEEGQNLIGLITLFHRMFKCFLYIKSGNSKSLVTDYIESNMNVPPYFVGKMVSKYIMFSDNYTEAEILKIFEVLNRYDINFRTGITEGGDLVKKLIPEIIDIRI